MLVYIIFITMRKINILYNLQIECEKHHVRLCYGLPEEETLLAETLYVCDNAEICKQLLEENAMVAAWLHEENREQDFSGIGYAIENPEEIEYDYLERIYRRYQNLPWTIAETERCIIREMTEEDLDAVYEVYSHPSITEYMEGLYENQKEEQEYTRSYIQNAYRFWGYGTWVIESKEEHKIIGRVGFNPREGFEEPELGFVITHPYQKQGYAYEVCLAALEVGQTEHEFTTVQALIKPYNRASYSLLLKLGFVFDSSVTVNNEAYLRYVYHYKERSRP